MKYHIDKNGKPAVCKATKRPCPLGGEESHFDTVEEAQAYADEQNAKEFGLFMSPKKTEILDMVNSGDYELTDDIYEAIYEIDGVLVSGEFEMGIRGMDHNALLDDNITWDDLQEHGMVIVPETETVFGKINHDIVDELGYQVLED